MDDILDIIKSNEKLIYSIASNFKNYKSMEDLYQAGCLGIITAYKNFDINRDCKFTTYAYPYIFGEMKKMVRNDKGIKISREISKLNLKIEKAYILLTQKLMREPSISEISNYLEVPEYYVSEAIMSLNKIRSIDEPVTDDNNLTLKDVIGKSTNIDELLMLKEELSKLTNEERQIIESRYKEDYTQSKTAEMLGMSQVQVSRSEQKILNKLKRTLAN